MSACIQATPLAALPTNRTEVGVSTWKSFTAGSPTAIPHLYRKENDLNQTSIFRHVQNVNLQWCFSFFFGWSFPSLTIAKVTVVKGVGRFLFLTEKCVNHAAKMNSNTFRVGSFAEILLDSPWNLRVSPPMQPSQETRPY